MRSIVVGMVANSEGAIRTTEALPWGDHGAQLLVDHSRWSSDDYVVDQPERIPLDWRHGKPVGVVKYLRRGDGRLWAVAEVDHLEDLPTVDDLSFSPQMVADRAGRIALESLALTPDPATCAIGNVQFIPGTLAEVARRARQQVPHYDLIKAAVEHRGGTSRIVDTTPAPAQPPLIEQRRASHLWTAPPLPGVHGRSEVRAARPTRSPTPTRPTRYLDVDGERCPVEVRPGRVVGVH